MKTMIEKIGTQIRVSNRLRTVIFWMVSILVVGYGISQMIKDDRALKQFNAEIETTNSRKNVDACRKIVDSGMALWAYKQDMKNCLNVVKTITP